MYSLEDVPYTAMTRLVEWIATNTAAMHKAIIGVGGGYEILATAVGLRRACRRAQVSPYAGVRCYHWGAGYNALMRMLRNSDARYVREAAKRGYDLTRRVATSNIIRPVTAADGTRDAWENDVEEMVLAGKPAFSMIVHLGVGRPAEILGDLDVLLPLMDDGTTVLLCGMEERHARGAYDRLTRLRGWGGAKVGRLAILQRAEFNKQTEE